MLRFAVVHIITPFIDIGKDKYIQLALEEIRKRKRRKKMEERKKEDGGKKKEDKGKEEKRWREGRRR